MPIPRFRLPTGILLALFAVTSPQAAPTQTDTQSRRRLQTQHRRHPGRRPRQRRPRLSRQRHQDAEHRRPGPGGRATGKLPRRAGLHPGPRRLDDRPLSDAPGSPDAGDLPQPPLRPAHRRTHPAAGAQGRGLRDLHGRQVAPRPRRPEILAAEPWLRSLLRQYRRRGRLLHPQARRHPRLAAQRRVHRRGGLLPGPDRRRGGQADRASGQGQAVPALFRLARAPCALSGAEGHGGPLCRDHRRPHAPHLRGHDHLARRTGRAGRRRARQAGPAREHPDRLQQRQRRTPQRGGGQRRAFPGGACRQRGQAGVAAGQQRRAARRQGQSA